MKKTLTALAVTAGLLVASGAVAVPASASQLTTGAGVVPAKVSDYPVKKRNKYWNAMKRLSSDARILGKTDTIETGTLVCDLLRAGGDLTDLAMIANDADSSIEDFVIASMAAAPIYLCPDQQYKFD